MSIQRLLPVAISMLAAVAVSHADRPNAVQFASTTRMVPIYATVRGSAGRLLTDLTVDDFSVTEDGSPKTIEVFSRRTEAIAILAMFQTGYLRTVESTGRDPQARALAAGHALVDSLWPADRLRHGTFGNEISISPISTSDAHQLNWIIDEETWVGFGHTPFWDALDAAIEVSGREAARRVIVVLGSGRNSSRLASRTETSVDVIARALRADVMVYGISLESRGIGGELREAADRTGGGVLEMGAKDDPAVTLKAVMQELHSQYLLGFVPASDGREHKLTVKVNVPGATVRARSSYFAGKH